MIDKDAVNEEVVETVETTKESEAEVEISETEALKAEIAALKDKMLRNTAELENFKRRTNEEKQNFMRYANSEVMLDVISVLDNFERALSSCECSVDHNALDGLRLIYTQISDLATKNGVEVVECVGEVFDPNFHQAVMTGKDDNYESGIVIEEFQKGYKIKDKILRPAMVKVNE